MNPTSNTILSTINELFSSLFSSIDSSIYSALDEIAFINTGILNSTYLEKILGTSSNNGILLIANALLIGFILYYSVRHLLSSFAIVESQNPYQFILKLILVGIFMNSSFFLCEQMVNLNSLLSTAIRDVGHNFLHADICFSKLIDVSNSIILVEENTSNVFSIDGIIKTIVSIGFLNLTFIYSIRYILLKVFILISPFAILCLSLRSTSMLFKSWLKCFFSLLFIELFADFILIVMFSIEYSASNLVSKLLFIGAIFALMKANNYVKELIGGISIDTYNTMYGMRNFIKPK